MAFLLEEMGSTGRTETDRQTDGRGATLNMIFLGEF